MNIVAPRNGSNVTRWLGGLFALVAVGCFSPTAVPGDPVADGASAVELYDAGKYAEARILLEKQVAAGKSDGPTLYRLYFCQREAGDSAARTTLLEARRALEGELESANRLETPFYLANVYRNTARLTDAKRVAQEATARVEAKKLPKPKDGMGMFQLGKLYADQERLDEAGRWYKKSIKAFARDGVTLPPAAQWAARHLGQQAFEAEDLAGVEEYLGALLEARSGTKDDYMKLAATRIRTADYEGAGTAWRMAGILNPVEGDHPRYCAQLAKQAHELGTLPEKAPDGRAWAELARDDLETLMSERANSAREELAAAPPRAEIDDDRAREIEAGIQKLRAPFIRAALEYAIRGLPIRETAFRAGYAPMIFHSHQWKLPPKPRTARRGPGRS